MLDGSFSHPADFADVSFSLFQSWAPEMFNSADQWFLKIFSMRKVFAKEISRLTGFPAEEVGISLEFHAMQRFLRRNPQNRYSVQCIVDFSISVGAPLGVSSCGVGRWDNSCDTSGYWFHQSTPGMARPQQQKFYNQQSQHQKKEENLS